MVGFGADLKPSTLVDAYRRGIFPWPHPGVAVPWFSPDPRAVLPLDGLRVSRSLRQRIRRCGWSSTVDAAFEDVVRACADRPGGEGTWIGRDMGQAYSRLWRLGWAHSLEVWDGATLVGGLYGVAVGGCFTGESMFHRSTDASKVALADLVARLGRGGRCVRRRAAADRAPDVARRGGTAPGDVPLAAGGGAGPARAGRPRPTSRWPGSRRIDNSPAAARTTPVASWPVRTSRRLRAIGLLPVLAATLLAGCGRGAAAPKGTATAPAGGYRVGRLVETFVDTRRPTPANGNAAEQPSRRLVTTLLYPAVVGQASGDQGSLPAAAGPFPLVVFAHGFTGSPAAYDGLLRAWAAAGYVIAAPAFPLSNGDAPGGPTQNDLPNQPGDVTFVITQVLLLANGDGPLRGAIDPGRIGVAGHSMGASTTLGVVRTPAATTTASGRRGPVGQRDPDAERALRRSGPDADPVRPRRRRRRRSRTPPACRRSPTRWPRSTSLTLAGADHNGPYTAKADPAATAVVRTTLDFLDRYLKGDATGLSRLRRDGSVAGVASLEAEEK